MSALPKPKAAKPPVVKLDLIEAAKHQKWIGTLQTWILALSAGIALVAAGISYFTSIKDQEFQSEIFANQTWENYRRLEMEYVEKYDKEAEYDTLTGERKILYELMVERLLMAADGVTIKLENDPQWRDAFVYEFRRHQSYLLAGEFLEEFDGAMSGYCTYRRGVRDWVRHSFKNVPEVSKRLDGAERVCRATLQREGYEE